jgi:hypothetical protein
MIVHKPVTFECARSGHHRYPHYNGSLVIPITFRRCNNAKRRKEEYRGPAQ